MNSKFTKSTALTGAAASIATILALTPIDQAKAQPTSITAGTGFNHIMKNDGSSLTLSESFVATSIPTDLFNFDPYVLFDQSVASHFPDRKLGLTSFEPALDISIPVSTRAENGFADITPFFRMGADFNIMNTCLYPNSRNSQTTCMNSNSYEPFIGGGINFALSKELSFGGTFMHGENFDRTIGRITYSLGEGIALTGLFNHEENPHDTSANKIIVYLSTTMDLEHKPLDSPSR